MSTFYQMQEKNAEEIAPIWMVLHMTCMTIIGITSFLAFYVFGQAKNAFGDRCFMNANLTLKLAPGANGFVDSSHPLDAKHSHWGSLSECYFCQFAPLSAMISAVIWAAMFIMHSKGASAFDRMYQAWRIILPALVCTIVGVIIMIIHAVKLNQGIVHFCEQFKTVLNSTIYVGGCNKEIDKFTLYFHPTEKHFTFNAHYAILLSYFAVVVWIVHATILSLRIVYVADFTILKITLTVKDKIVDSETDQKEPSSKSSSITSQIGGKLKTFRSSFNEKRSTLDKTDKDVKSLSKRDDSVGFLVTSNDDFPYLSNNSSIDSSPNRKAETERPVSTAESHESSQNTETLTLSSEKSKCEEPTCVMGKEQDTLLTSPELSPGDESQATLVEEENQLTSEAESQQLIEIQEPTVTDGSEKKKKLLDSFFEYLNFTTWNEPSEEPSAEKAETGTSAAKNEHISLVMDTDDQPLEKTSNAGKENS